MIWDFVTDLLKKKVCRYLLQRYLGRFLEEKLTLDQLQIDLYQGTGTLCDVNFSCQALNELCERHGWGVEVTEGHIGHIKLLVPWNALLSQNTYADIENLTLTLRPKAREKECTSMLESMWSSMSSSVQLAQECMTQESESCHAAISAHIQAGGSGTMEGLDTFTQMIDNILNRITARLINPTIRLEYLIPNTDRGIAIIVKINKLEYKNEASSETTDDPNYSSGSGGGGNRDHTSDNDQPKTFSTPSFSIYQIKIEDITFETEEFRIVYDTVSGANVKLPIVKQFENMNVSDSIYQSTVSVLSNTTGQNDDQRLTSDIQQQPEQTTRESSSSSNSSRRESSIGSSSRRSSDSSTQIDSDITPRITLYCTKTTKFLELAGSQELRIKLNQMEQLQGPKVELEMSFGIFNMFLTPRQLHLIYLLSDKFIFGGDIIETPDENVAVSIQQQQQQQQQDYSSANSDYREGYNKMTGGLGYDHVGWSSDSYHQYQDNQYAHQQQQQQQQRGGLYQQQQQQQQSERSSYYSRQHHQNPRHPPQQYPQRPPTELPIMNRSMFLASNSSMTSSMHSTTSQGTGSTITGAGRRYNRYLIDADPNADISRLNIRISCCAIVLLHEDILIENSTTETTDTTTPVVVTAPPLADESVKSLNRLSELYFKTSSELNKNLQGNGLQNARKLLDSSCSNNHLRLLLAPIIVEGEEQRNEIGNLLRVTASVSYCDIQESFGNKGKAVPIVEMKKQSNDHFVRPAITIGLKQTTHHRRERKRPPPPKTELSFSLAPCISELDISITDRLNAILNPSPFLTSSDVNSTYDSAGGCGRDSSSPATPTTDDELTIKINAEILDLRLRFPIADMRPKHDENRLKWWEQNVRDDFLLIRFTEMRLHYVIPHSFRISGNQVNVYYCKSESSEMIEIAEATTSDKYLSQKLKPTTPVKCPRISIEIPTNQTPKTSTSSSGGNSSTSTTTGFKTNNDDDAFSRFAHPKRSFSPFSSKRILRHSDTTHKMAANNDCENDFENNTLLPGDLNEIQQFCQDATKLSKIQVKINLPVLSLQIKSKHLYEVIYNRINTDLLLWEPSAPKINRPIVVQQQQPAAAAISSMFPLKSTLENCGMMESIYVSYSMAQSNLVYESCSSESEDDPHDNQYFSMHDHASAAQSTPETIKQSAMILQLIIGRGMITLYSPVRDAQGLVIPGHLGEFVLKTNSTLLFTVSGVDGDDDISYLCLQSGDVELYHQGVIPATSCLESPPLRHLNCGLPDHMQSTFYPTPKQLQILENKNSTDRDMITLAMEIQKSTKQNVKKIKMAAGIQNGTLRHNSALAENTWLMQLLDMFDVQDFAVEGYTPLAVVTELHLHLWDCAIDYRPLNLPYRAVVTLGTFILSSNISSLSSGCTLRFVAEDCTLSLAPQTIFTESPVIKSTTKSKKSSTGSSSSSSGNSNPPSTTSTPTKYKLETNKITCLPANELVCVLDLGLFEMSLRLNDKATMTSPKFDLRATINDVHLRTCADSADAFGQFIGYLAIEGDLEKPEEPFPQSDPTDLAIFNQDLPLSSTQKVAQDISGVTESQKQHVTELMAEAMKECLSIPKPVNPPRSEGSTSDDDVEVFFFPDEQQHAALKKRGKDRMSRSQSLCEEVKSHRIFSDISASSLDVSHEVTTDEAPKLGAQQDTVSINTETRELLEFENSMMVSTNQQAVTNKSSNQSIDEAQERVDAKFIEPQVAIELGSVAGPSLQRQEAPKPPPSRVASSDTDDEFCIIGDEERPSVNTADLLNVSEPLRIIDNHFGIPIGKSDLLQAPANFPMAVMRYTLCEMTITWHIYGGNDFPNETDVKKKQPANEQRQIPRSYHSRSTPTIVSGASSLPSASMTDAYRMGVSYSKGSPNVMFGINNRRRTWKQRGGINRKHDILMEVQICKMRMSHEVYPPSTEQASRQVLLIREVEIRDKLVESKINKFLYLPKGELKKGSQHMIVIKALHLRPNPALPTQECCLRISLLPIRVHIDQDSLLFLIDFFTSLGKSTDDPSNHVAAQLRRSSSTTTYQMPVMMVDMPDEVNESEAKKLVSENLMLLMDEQETETKSVNSENLQINDENTPIYFRNIVFGPEVTITLDYQGKRVHMSHGPVAGLIMGLGQLQYSEIRLKPIVHRHGILGIDRLIKFLLQEWLNDIRHNQLSSVLRGVGPMNTIVQLMQGIMDLFTLPFEEYRRNGSFTRGIQRGAESFGCRTAFAILDLTSRLIYILQYMSETAYDIVSPGPSVSRRIRPNQHGGRTRRLLPPQDIREGVSNALIIVREGVGDTAHTIREVTALEHDQKGYTGAVGAVIRQIPPTVMKPIVLATQATSNVLGGVRNQLVPDARREAKEKWKDDDRN